MHQAMTDLRMPFVFAVGLHLLVLIALLVHWQSDSQIITAGEKTPIQAYVITEAAPKPMPTIPVKEPKPAPPIKEPQPTPPPIKEPEQAVKPSPLKIAKEPVVKEEVTKVAEAKPTPAVKPVATPVAKPAEPNAVAAAQPASVAKGAPNASDIDRYRTLIAAAIGRYWNIPPNLNAKLTAVIMVRLAPGGVVLDARVVESSGNNSLDQSALLAVNKASPLPVPDDAELFDQFRELRLTVRPEGIITTSN